MLIHEVTLTKNLQINEGLLDNVRGTFSTDPAAKQQQRIEAFATKVQNAWNAYKTKYANSLRDPEERENYLSGADGLQRAQLENFVETNLLQKNSINDFVNADKINALIDKIVTRGPSVTQSTSAQPSALTQPTQTAASTSVQPSPTQSTASIKKKAPMTTPRGTKVVNGEPLILRMRGIDYIRNEQGDWSDFKTHKVAPESHQAFLDKESDYLDNAINGTVNESTLSNDLEHQLFVDLVHQVSLATPASSNQHTLKSRQHTRVSQVGSGVDLKSTGNDDADEVLRRAGFTIV